jgi:hypothetical protein
VTDFRIGEITIGQRLATELFPNNALNNGITMGNIIDCAHLCVSYLYCSTFSYNQITKECRFLVGMNATGNAAALIVGQIVILLLISLFVQAESGCNTYDIMP